MLHSARPWPLLVLLIGCENGGAAETPDAGGDSDACVVDGDCSDELFCNGFESCAPESPDADDRGCVADAESVCAEGRCDEDADACLTGCEAASDADGDGAVAIACGGDDCDDADPDRYPGNPELCDAAGKDEDCDPLTLGDDSDGDGETAERCCNTQSDESLLCGRDCDDTRSTILSSGAESCNGFDDDCDGTLDEGVQATFYRDVDGDGFGTDGEITRDCAAPSGFAVLDGDCDDSLANVNPGVGSETCDGSRDDDCDGAIDEGCACTTGASRDCGFEGESGMLVDAGECAIGRQRCEGSVWLACEGATLPATEECNDLDDDCDGNIDETTTIECVPDTDGDGFGAGATRVVCASAGACPSGFVDPGAAVDCDDGDDGVYPEAPEVCNGEDDDCDGNDDDAFPCVQGETVVGTGDCGREGSRRCAATCAWLDPGFVSTETNSTCDYCDDTLTGIASETGFATSTFRHDFAPRPAGWLRGAPRGVNFLTNGLVRLADNISDQGMTFYGPIEVGHGPITFHVEIEHAAGTETEGWSMSMLEGSTPSADIWTPASSAIAVSNAGPQNANGVLLNWWYYRSGRFGTVLSTDDRVSLSRLRRDASNATMASRDAPFDNDTNGQRAELIITPDVVGTAANETEVRVRISGITDGGITTLIDAPDLSCGPSQGRSCSGLVVTPGETYYFVVTGRSTNDDEIDMTGGLGADAVSDSFVEITGLCDPPTEPPPPPVRGG